jgi:diguanylate cyclase (GGDEF)-like protein
LRNSLPLTLVVGFRGQSIMGTTTISGSVPARSVAAFIDTVEDDRTRKSISRQVKGVVIGTILLAAVFLTATANAVFTIDHASVASDRARAERAVERALADGRTASNSMVREIGETFQLEGARLIRSDAVLPNESTVPLTGDYVMAYSPRRLGTETFLAIAPIRISLAVLIIAGISLVLHRLHSLAKHIDARRVAARTLAVLDPLTGLSNRLDFNERLASQLASETRTRSALLLLDLDGFKSVNDRFGHLAGDRLLQDVAERLRAYAAPHDRVCRLGGDEFAIIRQEVTSRKDLAVFATGLVQLVSAPYRIDGAVISVSVSVGICRIEEETRDAETLIRSADTALYRAKAQPGGAYEFGTAVRESAFLDQDAA